MLVRHLADLLNGLVPPKNSHSQLGILAMSWSPTGRKIYGLFFMAGQPTPPNVPPPEISA